jgi:hypothetical protein
MAVPTDISALSTTAASNSPVAADNVFPDLDDFLRFHSAALASIYANTATNGWVSPYMPKAGGTFTGAVTGITDLTTTGNTILGNAQGDTLNVAAGAVAVGAAGNVTIAAPSSGVALAVTGLAGTKILQLNGSATDAASAAIYATSGNSAILRLGGNALDAAGFDVQQDDSGNCDIVNRSNTRLSVYTNSLERLQIAAAGNITVNAPTSGVGLTVSGGGIAVTGTSALEAVTGTTGTFSTSVVTTLVTTSAASLDLKAATAVRLFANNSQTLTICDNGAVLFNPRSEPSAPAFGMVYYDNSTNKLRCYNGSTWNDLF